ncbi:hypothetical protein L604_000700001010 [Bacillus subtilis J27]|uniref:hypothetical protein n=1 Tax=Bacillus subtilis TaxID=1423 RepID=UPI0011A809E1|nr:hypothetical protein [Bacillus subtilis]TWG74406.1 hypothetical protein L604_000700001010 [Bacillus subtilis J27]
MGNKKSNSISPKQGCLLICLIILCLGVWIAVFSVMFEDDSQTVVKEENKLKNEDVKEKSPKDDVQSQVEKVISGILGKKTNYGDQRILELQVNDHYGTSDEEDKIIIATILGNENLTTNLTRKGMLLDSVKLFKELFALENSQEVTLIWQYPLVDVNGNTKNETVLKISLDRESASNINWESFDNENLKIVANEYWEHSAIQN